jgi:hypothetical protein
MFHASLDESGIHANSGAAAVIAAVSMPAAWEKFESRWTAFVRDVGVRDWHHRDFCNRRKGYGSLTDANDAHRIWKAFAAAKGRRFGRLRKTLAEVAAGHPAALVARVIEDARSDAR